jgi:hypothetical protein
MIENEEYCMDILTQSLAIQKSLSSLNKLILANRGTALGDLLLQSDGSLKYQGIKIQGVPHFPVTAGTPDKSNILLAHRQNLIAGYRRAITFESFRDPREGGTSFVVTARVDAKISWVPATAIATNVDVEI